MKGPDFSKKKNLNKMRKLGQKCNKIRVFEFIKKFGYYLFLNFGHNQSLYYSLSSYINPMPGKKLVPETRKNVISQSDLRILKFTVPLQQNDEIARFLACSKRKMKFIKIEGLLKNFWVDMVKWI